MTPLFLSIANALAVATEHEPGILNGAARVAEVAEKQPNPMIPALPELAWGAATFFVVLLFMVTIGVPRVQRVMDNRAKKIQDDLDAAERAEEAAVKAKADYNAAMTEARAEASRIIDAARVEAAQTAAAARVKVEAELAGVKASKAEDLRGAKERALVSLAGDVNGLAVELAEKAVGQSLDHGAQLAFLAALQPNQNN